MRSLSVILLIIVAFVTLRLTVFSEPEQAGGGAPQNAPMPVTAVIAGSSSLNETVSATGTLLAAESVDLLPESSGKVIRIAFEEGTRVQKGHVLVKLNDADLQASLSKVQSQLSLAKQKLDRLNELVKIKGVSVEERDQMQESVVAAEADIAYLQAQIAKTEIRAPFSGRIGLRKISEGAFVSTTTPVATLVNTEYLKLDFSLPERYSNAIKLPFEVSFITQGEEKESSAHVYAMEPALDQNTRSIRLRARVDNKAEAIQPGRFANVNVPIHGKANVVLVPTESIIPVLKGQQVWISRQGQAQKQAIEVGFRNERYIEVISGVQAGDTILTTGIMSLRPGTPLKFTAVKAIEPEEVKP